MTEGDGDEDDRTQRLVAELAEVRRRMSRRAIPVAPKSTRSDSTGPSPRLSTPPATSANTNAGPNARSTSGAPRPALGDRIHTQRIVIDEPGDDDAPPVSQRPSKG
jgi:hypothetical protein